MTSVPYQVSLPAFAGPLDLLLHLIDEAEVDICDISIAEIATQYLDYLHAAQSLDLEVAMEFLVMAATLMLMKARALVPREASRVGDVDGDSGEPDAREELILRLLEYRRFKDAARQLASLEESASMLISRDPSTPVVGRRDLPLPGGLTPSDLYDAFRRVISAQREITEPFRRIPREEINVGQAMKDILARVTRHGTIRFEELFDGFPVRSDMIAAFLGLLELVRLRRLWVHQGGAAIEITLRGICGDDIERSEGHH